MYEYEMYERMRLRTMRRTFSTLGWALLIYNVLMTVIVVVVVFMDALNAELFGQSRDHSGWGYLLTIAVGGVILLLWKKPRFCLGTLWQRGKPMKLGSFFALLTLCLGAQFISQMTLILLEVIFNSFGLSVMDYLLTLEMGDTFSMFLYMSLGAPLSEEILFRGLVMRSMEPYGKKFAIFASALLFGLFHGNLIQIPFAFAVGLVLGYVAMEYNIAWAVVLHMFNNLIFADSLPRLMGVFAPRWENLLSWAIILLTAIASAVIRITRRRAIGDYLRREQTDKLCLKAFFGAAGIIVLMIVLILSTVGTLFMMAA